MDADRSHRRTHHGAVHRLDLTLTDGSEHPGHHRVEIVEHGTGLRARHEVPIGGVGPIGEHLLGLLETDPLGTGSDGQPVYLRDIWPTPEEVRQTVAEAVVPEQFQSRYGNVWQSNERWNAVPTTAGDLYEWQDESTYIQEPPFLAELTREATPPASVSGARVLLALGDSVTTDHISPAGSIAKDSPAGRYLVEHGVPPEEFNSYGARRGNDRVMTRGTFANIRIRNLLAPGTEGGVTRLLPEGEQLAVYDAAVKYRERGVPLVVLAGAEYGKQDTRNSRNDAHFVASNDDQVTFAFSDPLAIPEYSLTDPVRSTQSQVEFASVFVQDEIEIGDYWIAVVGARIDQFDIDVWDDIAGVDGRPRQLSRADTEISPRAGIIWKPLSALSVYLNYSESFLPRSGDQFLTLTPSSAALEPESFENLEGGFKWAISAGTTLSAAAFEITRAKGTAVDPTNPERSVLTGTETRGLEVEISGLIAPAMMISASYTYLDGEELGRYLNDEPANRALPQVPEHKIALWSDLQLAARWRLGLGLIHQSAQYASLSNTVELSDFTRVDAALYFDVSPSLSLQVNMENLLDEGYFPSAHNDNNISVGAPRNARVSFSYTL